MPSADFTEQGRRVADHWSRLAVTYEGVLKTLEERGIAVDKITVDDLHALDMLHMGGLAATDELASLAGIAKGHCVLDVGSGVGGPARRLASKYGATVCGLELSKTLYETAVKLTDLVGLSGDVRFVNGSALSLPFEDSEFDVVAMAHVAMQITEKDQLFGELARVLKPHGQLALHEIFGDERLLQYPLSWATEATMSAVENVSDCSSRLSSLGFDVGEFVDHSEQGRQYHAGQIDAYDAALSEGGGTQGLAKDAVEKRRAASIAMEKNLGSGAMQVGILVAQKQA
jgi:SAM-dependent methyltransferase